MIRVLLAKDLRRARRNPTPWLVHLAMPLLITALIGFAFGGGSSGGGGLGRIKLALVDEDDSVLTGFSGAPSTNAKRATSRTDPDRPCRGDATVDREPNLRGGDHTGRIHRRLSGRPQRGRAGAREESGAIFYPAIVEELLERWSRVERVGPAPAAGGSGVAGRVRPAGWPGLDGGGRAHPGQRRSARIRPGLPVSAVDRLWPRVAGGTAKAEQPG
jgi:hypothetical protein